MKNNPFVAVLILCLLGIGLINIASVIKENQDQQPVLHFIQKDHKILKRITEKDFDNLHNVEKLDIYSQLPFNIKSF